MPLDLVNVGGESCEPVAALAARVYIAPYEDFDTINDPADLCGDNEAASVDLLAAISADHTFKTGKGFTQMTATEETGTITYTLLGTFPNRLYQNQLVLELAGSSATLLGFARQIKNKRFIILVEEFGSGNLRQLGNKRYPARLSAVEGSLEALAEGANKVTLTVQDKSKWPAAIYTGVVTEFPVT